MLWDIYRDNREGNAPKPKTRLGGICGNLQAVFLSFGTFTPGILVGVGGFTAVMICRASSLFGQTVRRCFRGNRALIQRSQATSPT